jgi:hypothetical protein
MILREININDIMKLLTEDQASDSIRKAIALYMNRMGCSKQEAEKFIRIDIREMVPNLRDTKAGKFILGVTRMFLNGELRDTNVKERLDAVIPYVASEAHINEYDKNLNGLTANEVINRFADAVKRDAEKDKELLAQKEYQKNNEYEIVRVDTFEDTSKYREYCYPQDQWCITKYPNMLDNYTNYGIGQFYFCLKKGFETMEPVEGENCPLDEYGLSMIAVCVDGNGRLKTSTCRWNHSNGGNDKILTTEQISEIIGCNFYEVFKPNDKFGETLREIKRKLAQGDELSTIFSHIIQIDDDGMIYRVRLESMYNLVKANRQTNRYELISDMWFDSIALPYGDYKYIKAIKNEDVYYINIHTEEIHGKDGLLERISNEIKTQLEQGNDISDLVDGKYDMYNGFTKIRVLDKRNIINNEGKLLLPNFYDDVDIITNSYSNKDNYYISVLENGRFTLLDTKLNNFLGKTFLRLGTIIIRDEFLTVKDEEGWNVISLKKNGKKMCERSFENYCTLLGEVEGQLYFGGSDKNGSNVYRANGELVGEMMNYTSLSSIYGEKYIYVQKNGKENILTLDGELLSNDEWYDGIEHRFYISETNSLLKIKNDGKESFFNIMTRKPLDKWFDKVVPFSYGDKETKVYENDKVNLLNINGEILLPEWVDDFRNGCYDFYIVMKDGKENIWWQGQYLLDEWALKIENDFRNFYIEYNNNDTYTLNIFDATSGRY